MNALVVDPSNRKRGKANALSLHKAGAETYFYDGASRVLAPTWEEKDLPDSFNLLFVHDNDWEDWSYLERVAQVIVRYTGNINSASMPPDEEWVRQRSLTNGWPLSEFEAKRLLEWASSPSTVSKPLLLLPPVSVHILQALSVLSIGYLAAHAAEIVPALDSAGWARLLSDDEKNGIVSRDLKEHIEEVRDPHWWLRPLDVLDTSENIAKDKWNALIENIQFQFAGTVPDEVNDFLKLLARKDEGSGKYVPVDEPGIVAAMHDVIEQHLWNR